MKIKSLLIGAVFLQFGCTNESTSDLIGDPVAGEVTYINTVKSVIDNNCLICHSLPPQNGAPMPLTTYTEVKDAILNRGLLNRISLAQGAPGMMPNGGMRLPQPTIDKIFEWANNGMPE